MAVDQDIYQRVRPDARTAHSLVGHGIPFYWGRAEKGGYIGAPRNSYSYSET